MIAKIITLVIVPNTIPLPKIDATAKTLVLNQIPLEKSRKSVTIKQFPTNDFRAR